jgi:hypothetical protein
MSLVAPFSFAFEWRLGLVCIVVVWGWLGWIGFHYIVNGLGSVIQLIGLQNAIL